MFMWKYVVSMAEQKKHVKTVLEKATEDRENVIYRFFDLLVQLSMEQWFIFIYEDFSSAKPCYMFKLHK